MTSTELAVRRVLVLETADEDQTLHRLLSREKAQLLAVSPSHASRLAEHVDEAAPHVVVASLATCPIAFVVQAARRCPGTPFVVVAPDSVDPAELIRSGVDDVVPASALTPERLTAAVTHAAARSARIPVEPARPAPAICDGDPRFRALTEATPAALRMQQAPQLETVGRLAGGVAHDFNNLLMVIGGETEYLLDTLPPESPLRGSVESIARAAERAASLTEQLLAFGRRQFLIARPVAVNDVVSDLQALLRREGVRTSVNLAPGLPPVRVDRARLDRALTNLVANARDAMGRDGLLTIDIDLVPVDQAMREGRPWLPGGSSWVRLQLTDTGPGIPADVLPHVFEPFFSTKEGGPATGLGLSTVYGIVKQSDGYVWIDSVPGCGARVTILLPPACGRTEDRVEHAG